MCFLHVGTHKTGTTSLQTALAANERVFAEGGLHVPRAGRVDAWSGHHNLAWELNEDRRFDVTHGTLADALDEIAQRRAPRVCLTSEDFEYLHVRPHGLRLLADGLRGIGYQPVVVVYLRPQADYAESLYAELVKHGLSLSFAAFLNAVIANGEFRFRHDWCFTFDYDRLLDDFAAVFGAERIIARRYESGDIDTVSDFLTLIGAGMPRPGGREQQPRRLNAGMRFADVLQRFESNARSRSGSERVPAIPRVRRIGGRFDPVHLEEAGRIVNRFNAGNKRVAARYGALVPCVSGRDLVADVAAATGIDPASRYRKRLVDVYARMLADPGATQRAVVNPGSSRESFGVLQFTESARIEAVVVVTAAFAAITAFSFGWQTASTTLVEFGLLSVRFAASSAGRCARYTADAHGVIADDSFFDRWGARLRTIGYGIVGLYAFVNALLDVGVPRYEPDWISYPGTLATGCAMLVLIAVLFARQRLAVEISGASHSASAIDHRFFIVCGSIAILVELAHAVAPQWWLDTLIDLVVVTLAGLKIRHSWRSGSAKVDALA